MVHNRVWAEAFPDYPTVKRSFRYTPIPARFVNLCLECLTRRLGRPLTPGDFTDAPINEGLR